MHGGGGAGRLEGERLVNPRNTVILFVVALLLGGLRCGCNGSRRNCLGLHRRFGYLCPLKRLGYNK